MDYQAYKKEFLESLRNDSAINGTDTEDEFLNRTLSLLVDYDEVNDPVRFGMGDKRGRGNRLMRADGYCFDETDHSLILFISDFQDSENAANLTRSRVDEILVFLIIRKSARLFQQSNQCLAIFNLCLLIYKM